MILGCVHLRWGLPCSLFPTLSSKSMHAWMHLDFSNTWQLIICTLTSQPLIWVPSTATSWSPRFICPTCARASTHQHVKKKNLFLISHYLANTTWSSLSHLLNVRICQIISYSHTRSLRGAIGSHASDKDVSFGGHTYCRRHACTSQLHACMYEASWLCTYLYECIRMGRTERDANANFVRLRHLCAGYGLPLNRDWKKKMSQDLSRRTHCLSHTCLGQTEIYQGKCDTSVELFKNRMRISVQFFFPPTNILKIQRTSLVDALCMRIFSSNLFHSPPDKYTKNPAYQPCWCALYFGWTFKKITLHENISSNLFFFPLQIY